MHCPEYGNNLLRGSLVAHLQTQHGMVIGGLGQEGDEEGGGDNARPFRMAFPEK